MIFCESLYTVAYFILLLLSPVTSYARNTQVVFGTRPSTYAVNCDRLTLSAGNSFKEQCRDFTEKQLSGPDPLSGTWKWEEKREFAQGGMMLVHQATGNLHAGLQRSRHRRRSQEGERMLGLPPNSHILQSSPPRSPRLPISHPLPSSLPSSPPSLPSSPPPSSSRAGGIGRLEISSPPTEAETRRICTLAQRLSRGLGRATRELRRMRHLAPEQENELHAACCKSVGGVCLFTLGAAIGQLANSKLAVPFYIGGTLAVFSAAADFHNGLREQYAPYGTDIIVKRRRSVDGAALGAPPHLLKSSSLRTTFPSSSAPSGSARREAPIGAVKYRRSQEGARIPGLSSSPTQHGPPTQHGQPRPSNVFEVSSPQGQANARRICCLGGWQRLTATERRIIGSPCKLVLGGCFGAISAGTYGLTHSTLAATPFAVTGTASALWGLHDVYRLTKQRPTAPPGPPNPVKRRRGLVGRKAEEETKKPEDKKKVLEAGGDLGHSGGASDEGIDMEGGDEGGDGGGGD